MRVCILGGSFDSGNLGLEALTSALVNGIWLAEPSAEVTVFDFVRVTDRVAVHTPSGPREVTRRGLNDSRRLWSSTSLRRMAMLPAIRSLDGGSRRALRAADLVIDISGGDSFTDLYGMRRLRAMCTVKELVLALGVPLILGPQTYGPFEQEESQQRARRILLGASQVWARDVDSAARARELVGPRAQFECRQGVDLAFALPPSSATRIGGIDLSGADRPAGLNVSGLLWNGGRDRARSLGLRVDYRELVLRLGTRLLEQHSGALLLVPHVLATPGDEESDQQAAMEAHDAFPEELRARIQVATPPYSASDAKALIGSCSWFAGSRMHATIAGLSTGVPTVGLAYSYKFRGVFESAGAGEAAIDLRALDTEEVIDRTLDLWERRAEQQQAQQEPRARLRVAAAEQVAEMLSVARRSGA